MTNIIVRLQEIEADIIERFTLGEVVRRNGFRNSAMLRDFLLKERRRDLWDAAQRLPTGSQPSAPAPRPRPVANPARTSPVSAASPPPRREPTVVQETAQEQDNTPYKAEGRALRDMTHDVPSLTADDVEAAVIAWGFLARASESPKAATRNKAARLYKGLRELVQTVSDEKEEVEALHKIERLKRELAAEQAKIKKQAKKTAAKKTVAPRPDDGSEVSVDKVREWARNNGYTVADRGRLSPSVHDAYAAAHEGGRT